MAFKFSQTVDSTTVRVLSYSTTTVVVFVVQDYSVLISGVLDHGSCSTYAALGIASTYCTAHELLKQVGFTDV